MNGKKIAFSVVLFAITCTSIFLLGEILVRTLSPVDSLYPRYQFSPEYGLRVYENVEMVHTVPGRYKFVYTTNEYGYRGKAIPPSRYYGKKVVLILGDSNSFGVGVNDGEEYPSRLAEQIGEDYIVVNLANPAWGLTQEIRSYYDFGILYHPTIVVLQFCGNDPSDNFNNMVTRIEKGAFVFRSSNSDINWLKKYLSRSILQKSQLYNFFRGRLYLLYENWHIAGAKAGYSTEKPGQQEIPPEEEFYRELLELFAENLGKNGVKLLFISVNHNLDKFPHIKQKIQELHKEGKIDYVDIIPWFNGISNYQSEEGHEWGRTAHEIIGRNLGNYIKEISRKAANGAKESG